ncbi:MAG: hypothetical protein LBR54_03840 [Oscillospiraceae bacterium]|jgi:hypothetical protein|nr:hypothetical protein [Oscillospiraceae bacterium]
MENTEIMTNKMGSVVNRIIEIDSDACTRLKSAVDIKGDVLKKVQADAENIRIKSKKDTDTKIRNLKHDLEVQHNLKMAEIESTRERKMKEADADFAKRHIAVTKNVLKKILGEV